MQEVPLRFMEKHGETLKRSTCSVDIGGGCVMTFKICSTTNRICGLKQFMRKYRILCNYMFLFTYIGNSKFALTVFDSLCDDHLRDMDGFLILDHYILPPDGYIYVDLSSVSGTLIEGIPYI